MLVKQSIMKLMVLQDNLGKTKGSLSSQDQENEHLKTSTAQVGALIESMRSGLEKSLS